MGITGKKREREIQRQTEEMLPTLFICGSHVLNAEKDCNEKQKITNADINIFAKLEICRKINLFLLLLVLLVYTVATAVNETNLYFFFSSIHRLFCLIVHSSINPLVGCVSVYSIHGTIYVYMYQGILL